MLFSDPNYAFYTVYVLHILGTTVLGTELSTGCLKTLLLERDVYARPIAEVFMSAASLQSQQKHHWNIAVLRYMCFRKCKFGRNFLDAPAVNGRVHKHLYMKILRETGSILDKKRTSRRRAKE